MTPQLVLLAVGFMFLMAGMLAAPDEAFSEVGEP